MFVGNGPRTTVQDLPSTRAGGQDEVSFTNSLKLDFPGWLEGSLWRGIGWFSWVTLQITEAARRAFVDMQVPNDMERNFL